MTSFDDVENQMLSELVGHDFHSDEATQIIKNYKVLVEANSAKEPQKAPKESWFHEHSDTLIKSGMAFLGVVVIVGGEKLGNHIYNTKAWTQLPK